MSRYLIKPNKEVDFYIEWSTIVDDAVSWGNREAMIEFGLSEDRLDRADKHGTSAFWYKRNGDDEEDGEIWKQQGWLRCSQMEDFFTAISDLYPGDEKIPSNLLELHPELREFLEPLE